MTTKKASHRPGPGVDVKSKRWADDVERSSHICPLFKRADPERYWRYVAEDAYRRGFHQALAFLLGWAEEVTGEEDLRRLIASAAAVAGMLRVDRRPYPNYDSAIELRLSKEIDRRKRRRIILERWEDL
jgi:hypothetical protein